MYSIRLQRLLYDLKESGRIWYNRHNEYLLSEGYINDVICLCVFVQKTTSEFVILVYIDNINFIETPKELH